MEKCGKFWRSDDETGNRHELRGDVFSMNVADQTHEMRACSACAGDYEDPDRTAWAPDDGEDEERDVAPRATTEELPAEDR